MAIRGSAAATDLSTLYDPETGMKCAIGCALSPGTLQEIKDDYSQTVQHLWDCEYIRVRPKEIHLLTTILVTHDVWWSRGNVKSLKNELNLAHDWNMVEQAEPEFLGKLDNRHPVNQQMFLQVLDWAEEKARRGKSRRQQG